jgi:hypothetical protein
MCYKKAYVEEVQHSSHVVDAYLMLYRQHHRTLANTASLASKCRTLEQDLANMQTEAFADDVLIGKYERKIGQMCWGVDCTVMRYPEKTSACGHEARSALQTIGNSISTDCTLSLAPRVSAGSAAISAQAARKLPGLRVIIPHG